MGLHPFRQLLTYSTRGKGNNSKYLYTHIRYLTCTHVYIYVIFIGMENCLEMPFDLHFFIAIPLK